MSNNRPIARLFVFFYNQTNNINSGSKTIENTLDTNILSNFVDNFYMISLLKNLLFTNIVYNFKNKSIIYKKIKGGSLWKK